MVDILDRLEQVSPVVILPGAETVTAAVIREFEETGGAAQAVPPANPEGEG
jgi:hypothetical protein